MTAAPIPPPVRHVTNIKGACFTPLSYFHRNLDLQYTQLRCFGLILVQTLGASKPVAEITYEEFSETFGISHEWVLDALSALEKMGMIRVGRSDRGRPVYSIREEYIQEAKNAGRQAVRGRCPDCKAIGEFSTEFIPTPHQALRKLGGCVNSATFRVVMTVIRYTLKWGKESRAVEVEPTELSLDDFTRLTGLESREITNGLTEAVRLGLIGRQLRKGKPSLFWAVPEKFGSLERREPRTVTQPATRGEKAKVPTPKNTEIPNEPEPTDASESRVYLYGRCNACKHLVVVEPVTEEEFAAAQPQKTESPPERAGPGREKRKTPSEKHLDRVLKMAKDSYPERFTEKVS